MTHKAKNIYHLALREKCATPDRELQVGYLRPQSRPHCYFLCLHHLAYSQVSLWVKHQGHRKIVDVFLLPGLSVYLGL